MIREIIRILIDKLWERELLMNQNSIFINIENIKKIE